MTRYKSKGYYWQWEGCSGPIAVHIRKRVENGLDFSDIWPPWGFYSQLHLFLFLTLFRNCLIKILSRGIQINILPSTDRTVLSCMSETHWVVNHVNGTSFMFRGVSLMFLQWIRYKKVNSAMNVHEYVDRWCQPQLWWLAILWDTHF